MVAGEAEGGEVLMMETTIVPALREMPRLEIGVTARGAEARAAGVPAGVIAGVQLAVLHPGEGEEVLEEVVEAVEAMADAEVQAIAATARAAEAETADVEFLVKRTTSPSTSSIEPKAESTAIAKFLVQNHEAMIAAFSTVYFAVTSGQI